MLWEKRSGFSFAKLVIVFLQLSFLIFLDKKSFSIQSYNDEKFYVVTSDLNNT